VAVEKVGIARSTVYKWRDEDEEFRTAMEAALVEGEAMLNDLGENQLYSLMLERHYPSIQFWLRHRNPKFKDKLEVTTHNLGLKEQLTPEQEADIRKALELASLTAPEEYLTQPNIIQHDTATPSTGTGGENNQGQESAPGSNEA